MFRKILMFEFSSNFDDFFQNKTTNFVYFSNMNGQKKGSLGLKLLKIIKISRNIPLYNSAKIEHPVALSNTGVICGSRIQTSPGP